MRQTMAASGCDRPGRSSKGGVGGSHRSLNDSASRRRHRHDGNGEWQVMIGQSATRTVSPRDRLSLFIRREEREIERQLRESRSTRPALSRLCRVPTRSSIVFTGMNQGREENIPTGRRGRQPRVLGLLGREILKKKKRTPSQLRRLGWNDA